MFTDYIVKLVSYQKRDLWAPLASPSFDMTMTKIIKEAFSRHVTHVDLHLQAYLTNLLRKEAARGSVSNAFVPNGQLDANKGLHKSMDGVNHAQSRHLSENLDIAQVKAGVQNQVQSKMSPCKDAPTRINTDPLVCKTSVNVTRTIQLKPDQDIKVDVNSNPDLKNGKAKYSNDSGMALNNNKLDMFSDEFIGSEAILDSSHKDSSGSRITRSSVRTRHGKPK